MSLLVLIIIVFKFYTVVVLREVTLFYHFIILLIEALGLKLLNILYPVNERFTFDGLSSFCFIY